MKRIIICFDGTCNAPEIMGPHLYCPTNVLHLTRLIETRLNKTTQIVLYLRGVGTNGGWDKWMGAARGHDIELNLLQGYQFIIDNYNEGDDIYLFGFSRGAFTARLLAGFLDAVKVIPKDRMGEFADVYDCYRTRTDKCIEKYGENFSGLSAKYTDKDRSNQHVIIPIFFLGVWDTVTTLLGKSEFITDKEGIREIPVKWGNDLTDEDKIGHPSIDEVPSIVAHAYQALALHEIRIKFIPKLWTSKSKGTQTVEQTWFPGAHSDVGGGEATRELSDIALEWMVDRARNHQLEFNEDRVAGIGPRKDRPESPRFAHKITESIEAGKWNLLGTHIRLPESNGIKQYLHKSAEVRFNFEPGYSSSKHQDKFSEIDKASKQIERIDTGADARSIDQEYDTYQERMTARITAERLKKLTDEAKNNPPPKFGPRKA